MKSKKSTKPSPAFPTAQSTKGEVTANFGGKKRTFQFGTNCTGLFMRMRGMTSVADYEAMFRYDVIRHPNAAPTIKPYFTLLDVRDLLFCALVADCYTRGVEPDFTEWTVGQWVDDLTGPELARIVMLKSESDRGPELPKIVQAKIKEAQENPNV
jgi:hypothetical protein